MSVPNNPAGRLLAILRAVNEGSDQQNMGEGWREALGIPAEDEATLYLRLGRIARLPRLIDREVRHLDGVVANPDRHVHHLPAVEKAILNHTNNRKSFRAAMGTARWDQLEHLDSLLSAQAPDLEIEDEHLEELRDLVGEAEELLEEAELPEAERQEVAEQLRRLREAVDDIRLFGVEEAVNQADATLGILARLRVRLGTDVLRHPLFQVMSKVAIQIIARKVGDEVAAQLPWPTEPLQLPPGED